MFDCPPVVRFKTGARATYRIVMFGLVGIGLGAFIVVYGFIGICIGIGWCIGKITIWLMK